MNEPDKQLEELIHSRLRKLPDLAAPPTLVPAVLEKIQARAAQSWWQRSWINWPPAIQAVSILLFVGLLVAAWFLTGNVAAETAQLAERARSSFGPLDRIVSVLQAVGGAGQVILKSINSQLLLIAAIVVGCLYLSTIGLGTMFYRVAIKR
jgi:hypothetical protein